MSETIVLDGEMSLEIPIDGEPENILRVGGEFDPDEILPIIEREVASALTEAKESGLFDGADGQDGQDGYTPIKGIDYFDGQDGKDGKDGKDGADGKDGKDGQDGAPGTPGQDYVLTSADKSEIAGLVVAGLSTETWTFTLDDDSTVTKEVVVMEQ